MIGSGWPQRALPLDNEDNSLAFPNDTSSSVARLRRADGLLHKRLDRQKSMAQTDTSKNGSSLGFEAELFRAADKLRGNMEPSDYKHVALGLIFLKYISDAFEAKHKALLAEYPQAAE